MHGVPFWVVAAFVTAVIWIAVLVWPRETGSSWGEAISFLLAFTLGVVATLIVWLVYFIIV